MTWPLDTVAEAVGALQGAAYDRTCYVQASTPTQDPATGEHALAWADAGGPFPCIVRDLSGAELEVAARLDPRATVEVRMDRPTDVTVEAEHRIRVVATSHAPARTLAVVHPQDPQGDGRWLHVTCREG